MSEWHRIDDPEHPAPKDGTDVLLWDGRRVSICAWRPDVNFPHGKSHWLKDDHDDFSCGLASTPIKPTHWAQLPPIPEPPRP